MISFFSVEYSVPQGNLTGRWPTWKSHPDGNWGDKIEIGSHIGSLQCNVYMVCYTPLSTKLSMAASEISFGRTHTHNRICVRFLQGQQEVLNLFSLRIYQNGKK